jgi:solute carrier family 25 carnitine/acylcarnitine transporter 20/29
VTDKKNLPIYVPFIAGGIGGTLYWMFNYPFDFVKTKMQTDKFGDFKYKTTLQCFQDNYREGGLKGFYKGYVICMMRSFPVNAAAVVVYRLMQRLSNVSSH